MQGRIVAQRINLQSFFEIGFSTAQVIAQSFNRGPQAQVLNSLRAFHLKFRQRLPRDLQLLLDGRIIAGIPISLNQIKTKLRGIKNSFSRAFRHGAQSGKVFADGIAVTTLQLG